MRKCKNVLIFVVFVFLVSVLSIPLSADDGNEPPANPWLADSPWAMSHRNPYCQASSPYPGPESVKFTSKADFTSGNPILITIGISAPYPDGSRVLWGSDAVYVYKADPSGRRIKYIDKQLKEDLFTNALSDVSSLMSGAYTLIDKDNIFYVPKLTKLNAYGDAIEGDPGSDVAVKRSFEIPATMLRAEGENIVGMNMTYDGMIAFVTNQGLVGVISRSFDDVYYLALADGDEVSNSIACDEDGGIYVVTSEKMYRVQWTGTELTTDESKGGWAADYETGDGPSGVRLGAGSGSTPTLMGTGDQDKFVCITDGKDLMNITLFWRDKIPSDWNQIEGVKDRRIAAQVPVTFGDAGATTSLSEQSVCIRGYGALVVNNQLQSNLKSEALSMLISGITFNAPYGAEKFEWDPVAREMKTAWVNEDVSIPNGIPTMSSETGLMYGVGQGLFGIWTFEALDWETGESVFTFNYGWSMACNSAFAATQVGLDGHLYTGTLLGMARMRP